MINEVICLKETDPMYKEIINDVENASDEDLVIIARSYKNRKHDSIKPIAVRNGVYFYVAYELAGKTAFLGNVTPYQIYKAKANMMRRARLGTMMEIILSDGDTIEEFEFNGNPMNTATLNSRRYGAGLLYCEEFLKAMEMKMGKYYILPSSIHEIILVPEYVMPKNAATEMVREVNAVAVEEDEFLADEAFELSDWI